MLKRHALFEDEFEVDLALFLSVDPIRRLHKGACFYLVSEFVPDISPFHPLVSSHGKEYHFRSGLG